MKKRFTEGIGMVGNGRCCHATVIIATVMDGGMLQGRMVGTATVTVGVGAIPMIGTRDTPCEGIVVEVESGAGVETGVEIVVTVLV